MKKKSFPISILFFLILFFYSVKAVPLAVDQVPNPQQKNGTWVSDTVSVLSSEIHQQLNLILGELRTKTGAEFAVVSVNNLNGLTVEDYANQLFKKWGIGDKHKNNGLLLLFSLEDRKVRIEVGYGLEAILPDAICKRYIEELAIPLFKQKKYSEGLFFLSHQIVEIILEKENQTSEHYLSPELLKLLENNEKSNSFSPREFIEKYHFYEFFSFYFVGFWLLLSTYSFIKISRMIDFYKTKNENSFELEVFLKKVGKICIYISNVQWTLVVLIFFSGIFFQDKDYAPRIVVDLIALVLLYFPLYLLFKTTSRFYKWSLLFVFPFFYKVKCPQCSHLMILLKGIQEEKILNAEEIAEQKAQGVDYLIYQCPQCSYQKQDLIVLKDNVCPKCKRNSLKIETQTLKAATYENEGLKKITETCLILRCAFSREETQNIPIKIRETSISTSSSDSSSSSSSSSFGGGSSGGGGASGSW